MELSKEERRRLVAEAARKQLAEGTWPQVMAVFGYTNPRAPRTPESEFDRLATLFEQASCPNMVRFIELLRFAEKERRVAVSFNFSMRRRFSPGEAPEGPPEEDTLFLFLCPDILVGTRGGIEGATVWLKHFTEALPDLAPESVQVTDKIFGEAIEFMEGPSQTITPQEALESIVLGKDTILKPPKVSKH